MKLVKGRVLVGVTMAALALVVLSTAAPAQAQSLGMRAKIPFEFHVGETKLPAGTYIVERRGDALWISDGNGHTAAVLSNAIPNRAVVDNQLVFNRYGDDRFLSEVRWIGYSNARGLIKSSKETQLARTFSPERVLTAGLAR